MVRYPIEIPRNHYNGSVKKKQAEAYDQNIAARQLEKHINDQVAAMGDGNHMIAYAMLAIETGIPLEVVEHVMIRVQGGHTGIIVTKGDPKPEAPRT